MSARPFLASAALAAVTLAAFVAAPAANASVVIAIPNATPTAPFNTELSLSDTYTSLPAGQLQPFAAAAFSLDFYLPAQATYTSSNGDPGFAIGGLGGFYQNNGQTEFFGGATAIFDVGLNTGGQNGFTLTVPNLLQAGDIFSLTADTSQILFDNTQLAGVTQPTYNVTFPTASFTITGGSAFYAPPLLGDPGATLGATGGTGALAPVPEPSSLALLFTGLVGLAAAVTLSRRRAA